jgi:GTP cyclohydrolase II
MRHLPLANQKNRHLKERKNGGVVQILAAFKIRKIAIFKRRPSRRDLKNGFKLSREN